MMTKEQQNLGEFPAAIDPGYLMLAMYVLCVTVLVLFGWLASSSVALETEQNGEKIVVSEQILQQPAPQQHFISDQV
ncbi:MAG: hypothetical protein ACL93V_06430 [Candidatus Electrothrix sp. YB6]